MFRQAQHDKHGQAEFVEVDFQDSFKGDFLLFSDYDFDHITLPTLLKYHWHRGLFCVCFDKLNMTNIVRLSLSKSASRIDFSEIFTVQ